MSEMKRYSALVTLFTLLSFWGCSDDFTILGYLNEPDLVYLQDAEISGDESSSISVLPEDSSIWNGETLTFSVSGGEPPYYYVLRNGPGSIDGNEGIYMTASEGLAEIRIFDSNLDYRDASVKVFDRDPSSLWISPISVIVKVGQQIQFEAGGGSGNYTISEYWPAGPPSVGSTYLYTAPSGYPYCAQIEVSDGITEAYATVIIEGQANFTVSPQMVTLRVGQQVVIRGSSGTPPYNWVPVSINGADLDIFDEYVVYTPSAPATGFIDARDSTWTDFVDSAFVSIKVLP